MKKVKSNWLYGISTHKSSFRDTNEDSAYLNIRKDKYQNELLMMVIADGMGGYERGDVASQLVVWEIDQWFRKKMSAILNLPYPFARIAQEIETLLQEVNNTLINKNKKMGTTVSILILYKGRYLVIHVGDSRIYQLIQENDRHDYYINQLTEDHSWVMDQVRKKLLTIEEANQHPKRNVIMQCVGINGTLSPFIKEGSFANSDLFLLCSDGFYNIYSEEMFLKKLQSFVRTDQSYQSLTDHLVKDADNEGATDNITVSIVTEI